MIAYTPDEIFDLLGEVSCERDVLEIWHYIIANCTSYTIFDFELFEKSINIYREIFK